MSHPLTLLPGRRRAWLWRGALLVVAAVVDAVLDARGAGVAAQLVLLVVVTVGLAGGPLDGALAGLLGGWCVDLVPPGSQLLGVAALSHGAAGYLAGRATRSSGWPPWWPAAVTAAGWALVTLVPVLRALTTGAPVAWAELLTQLLVTATVAVVAVPVLLVPDRRLAARRRR